MDDGGGMKGDGRRHTVTISVELSSSFHSLLFQMVILLLSSWVSTKV